MPVALVRGHDGELRAFYNVCQHRAHELLSGTGRTDSIVCGYHGWTYELSGRLARARRTAACTTSTALCSTPRPRRRGLAHLARFSAV